MALGCFGAVFGIPRGGIWGCPKSGSLYYAAPFLLKDFATKFEPSISKTLGFMA